MPDLNRFLDWLDALIAAPRDGAQFLVFADWLEDEGWSHVAAIFRERGLVLLDRAQSKEADSVRD